MTLSGSSEEKKHLNMSFNNSAVMSSRAAAAAAAEPVSVSSAEI